MAGRLTETGVAVDEGIEDQLAEMHPDFFDHLVRQPEAGVVHGKQDALDAKAGIESALYDFDGVEQLAQSLEGEVFALNRDDHAVRCSEGIQGDEAQRRGAIDQNEVEFLAQRLQSLAHPLLSLSLANEFDFCTDQVDVGGQEPQVGVARFDDGGSGVRLGNQTLVGARFDRFRIDPNARAAVGLRIRIHQEGPVFQSAEARSEVDGGGRLSDAAFLVCNGDDLAHVQNGMSSTSSMPGR